MENVFNIPAVFSAHINQELLEVPLEKEARTVLFVLLKHKLHLW